YSVPLTGRLFMSGEGAPHLVAGLATSPSFLWGSTSWYDNPYVGFATSIEMDPDFEEETFVIANADLGGGIWWEAVRRTDGQVLAYDMTPSGPDAEGTIDFENQTWTLSYEVSWSNGDYEAE